MKRWVIAAMAPLAVVAIAEKRHPGSSTLLRVHRNGRDLYIALGS